MTIARLREVHQARPFQPYRLQFADGTAIRVTHPECVAFHPKSPRTVAVVLPNGAIKIIDLLLIAAIHVGGEKAGRRRR